MIPANDPVWDLPEGFLELRSDVGVILKTQRKKLRMKQSAVADIARITVGSLSRIENKVGDRMPNLGTVTVLLDALDLDWEDVALPVQHDDLGVRDLASAGVVDANYRKDKVFELGAQIRAARRTAKRSLRDLAAECGISAAQLSRLERGVCADSRVYKDAKGWENEPRKDRLVEIVNEVLARLVSCST
jgi:transcriptional regulator with XRE-family HTH domain